MGSDARPGNKTVEGRVGVAGAVFDADFSEGFVFLDVENEFVILFADGVGFDGSGFLPGFFFASVVVPLGLVTPAKESGCCLSFTMVGVGL